MSAVYGVGGESDAIDIALFFVALHHPASLSLENLKAKNLGYGQSPVSRRLNHRAEILLAAGQRLRVLRGPLRCVGNAGGTARGQPGADAAHVR